MIDKGPFRRIAPRPRPPHGVCACCIFPLQAESSDGYCRLCSRELASAMWRPSSSWLRFCAEQREQYRIIDAADPTILDYHEWRYLHEDGQDHDEREAGAISHEEARKEVRP